MTSEYDRSEPDNKVSPNVLSKLRMQRKNPTISDLQVKKLGMPLGGQDADTSDKYDYILTHVNYIYSPGYTFAIYQFNLSK